MGAKLNAQSVFNQRPIVINKISNNSGTTYEKYCHQHNIHCARTAFIIIFIFSESYFGQFHFFNSFGTFFNEWCNQFFSAPAQSKYSPASRASSHSYTQLLGFQINPLSINSLHSHLHLSLFQRCLLLQILAQNLRSHLYVSCYSMCLVSLDIRLNTLTFKFFTTSGTQIFSYVQLILYIYHYIYLFQY